jgi:excisionase family DNA binding protein
MLAATERYLTIRDVATRLGVHEDTVRRKIASLQLPATQLGGRGSVVRIRETDLETWLSAQGSRRARMSCTV